MIPISGPVPGGEFPGPGSFILDDMASPDFGKYRLIAELGHGGMADVYLGVIEGFAGSGFSKLVVVKRLRSNLVDDPEFIKMLVDEARIAARLNHPNVVQTNEVGVHGKHYFIAMEYIDGQPLNRIQHRAMKAGKDFRDIQVRVIVEMLAGLHHAHELADYDGTPLGIVHRDVTPHNVLVSYDGQVKLVDFGIAKAERRLSQTEVGVVKGKVRYMSPEQVRGLDLDRRADIFAAGIMLWEAVTGQRFWGNKEDIALVHALLQKDFAPSPKTVRPDVSDSLDRICQKALAYHREDRYQTAGEFSRDLEQAMIESGRFMQLREQLGPFVCDLFGEQRKEIKEVIERQIAEIGTSQFRPVILGDVVASKPTPSTGSTAEVAPSTEPIPEPYEAKSASETNTVHVTPASGTLAAEALITGDSARHTLISAAKRGRKNTWMMAVGGALLAGVVVMSAGFARKAEIDRHAPNVTAANDGVHGSVPQLSQEQPHNAIVEVAPKALPTAEAAASKPVTSPPQPVRGASSVARATPSSTVSAAPAHVDAPPVPTQVTIQEPQVVPRKKRTIDDADKVFGNP